MARYIDADALLQRLPDDLPYKGSVKRVLLQAPTADVVPKAEVEKIFEEIEKTIRATLILIDFSYKHNQKETQCKKECYEDFLGYIAELKKKYTEKGGE